MSELKQPWQCQHANECPIICPCDKDCYCHQSGTCQPMGLQLDKELKRREVHFADIYGVMYENDFGSAGVMGYFSTAAKACEYGKGKDGYGGDCQTKTFPAIIVEDVGVFIIASGPIDLDRKKSIHDEDVRANALMKLNAEEKRVLGIK